MTKARKTKTLLHSLKGLSIDAALNLIFKSRLEAHFFYDSLPKRKPRSYQIQLLVKEGTITQTR